MVREIPLTQGKVAVVDDEDYADVARFKWQYSASHTGYAKRTVRRRGGFETVRMHRVIMAAAPDQDVDHRNGDGLDNRRSNLRLCTTSQNCKNRRPNKVSATGIKGVRLTPYGKWTARITVQGVRRHLGTFNNPLDATLVRDAAAVHIGGEFAFTNKGIVFAEENEEAAPKRIIVNGRAYVTRERCIGFSDISIYTMGQPYDTVTFRHGPENHTEGELVPNGPVVVIVDGMEFEAANTGSA